MKNLRERMPNIRDVPRLIRKNIAETKETIRTQVHSVLLMLGIVHDTPAAGPEETSKDSSRGASGLRWEEIGKPEQGTEISSHALAAALKEQTTFTQAEWDNFEIANLSVDSFIKVDDRYTHDVFVVFPCVCSCCLQNLEFMLSCAGTSNHSLLTMKLKRTES